MLRLIFIFLAGLVLCAQTPIPGFPPGTFQNRAAIDASGGATPLVLTFNNSFVDNAGTGQTVIASSLVLGSSPLTLIACGVSGGTGLTGVTFGGQTLTQVGATFTGTSGAVGCFFFFFSNPGTANLTMTFTGSQFIPKVMMVWTATGLATGGISFAGANRSSNVGGAASISNAVGDLIVAIGRDGGSVAGKPAWTTTNGSSETLTLHSSGTNGYQGGDLGAATATVAPTWTLQDTSIPDGIWGGASFR